MMQEFVDEIRKTVKSQLRAIHTVIPGKIVSFDASTGLATVLPIMMFRMPNGETVPYPHISDVPVMFPSSAGQDAVIAFPVKAGDGCLILTAEKSIDYWFTGHETETDLAFDLTNAICIPGLFVEASDAVKEACESDAVIIKMKDTKLSVGKKGVEIDAEKVTIKGNLELSGTVTENVIMDDELVEEDQA